MKHLRTILIILLGALTVSTVMAKTPKTEKKAEKAKTEKKIAKKEKAAAKAEKKKAKAEKKAAKAEKKAAKQAAKEEKLPKTFTVNDMYAFGCCMSLKDSIVYMTDIQLLPTAALSTKTKFLENRADYSRQLKHYFTAQGKEHMMCTIVYNRNRKKLEKEFTKIYNKNQHNGESFVTLVPLSVFSFEKLSD